MSVKSNKFYILLYTFFVIASSVNEMGCAASPAKKTTSTSTVVKDDPIIESMEEINDLNKNIILRDSSSMSTSEPAFNHLDEDTLDNERLNTILDKMKKDVEILESNDALTVTDSDQLEERFRGPAIVINTDEFISENIEMNAADEAEAREADQEALATSHMVLSIILVVVILISIGLYAALVMWRSHMERRYGMRELLVTNDNQDYWPQHMTDPPSAIPTQFPVQQQQQQQQQQQPQRA